MKGTSLNFQQLRHVYLFSPIWSAIQAPEISIQTYARVSVPRQRYALIHRWVSLLVEIMVICEYNQTRRYCVYPHCLCGNLCIYHKKFQTAPSCSLHGNYCIFTPILFPFFFLTLPCSPKYDTLVYVLVIHVYNYKDICHIFQDFVKYSVREFSVSHVCILITSLGREPIFPLFINSKLKQKEVIQNPPQHLGP